MNEPLTPEQHNFVTPHEHPHALDEEGRCMVCSISYAGGVLYKQITALREQVADLTATVTYWEHRWHVAATHDADMDYIKEVADLTSQLAQAQAEIEDWRKKFQKAMER